MYTFKMHSILSAIETGNAYSLTVFFFYVKISFIAQYFQHLEWLLVMSMGPGVSARVLEAPQLSIFLCMLLMMQTCGIFPVFLT